MNEMKFKKIKQTSIANLVAEQIKELILSSTLKPGDKLPSERDMAAHLNVGRVSVREGIRILETLGLAETKYGVDSGTYVSKPNLLKFAERFGEIIGWSAIDLHQLMEARLEVSLINIKYFMLRATESDIKKLEDCLQEMEDLIQSGVNAREKTMLFHQLIAYGAGNPLFIFLHNSLLSFLRQYLSDKGYNSTYQSELLKMNTKMLGYLKAKNPERASALITKQVQYLEKVFNEL